MVSVITIIDVVMFTLFDGKNDWIGMVMRNIGLSGIYKGLDKVFRQEPCQTVIPNFDASN